MDYLYILPLTDNKHIKIGISSGDITRVIKHQQGYDIKLNEVLILKCHRRSLALKIESYILNKLVRPDSAIKFSGLDGNTEIRSAKDLEKVKKFIQDIKSDPYFSWNESKVLDYKLLSLNEFIKQASQYLDLTSQVNKLSTLKTTGDVPKEIYQGFKEGVYFTYTDNVKDFVNKYSLYLIKTGKTNKLSTIFSEVWTSGVIFDLGEWDIYNQLISAMSDAIVIKYKKDLEKYYVVADPRMLFFIMIKMKWTSTLKPVDFNEMMFKAVILYLHMDKATKGITNWILSQQNSNSGYQTKPTN